MTVALIVAGSVLAGLLILAFIVWAHQYTKAGPNEVLIISGRRGRKEPGGAVLGYRIVRGGGTYVRPFREKVQRLSLELMQFDVRTSETYSMHGVPVQVDGVCMVKVDPSDEGIQLAAEQFLSRGRDDIVRTAQQAVEGHLRAAVGAHSIEDVYRERAKLISATKDQAEPDLHAMGLEVVSLTIRSITDKQGYLEALGRPRTAQVKRDAIQGEAEAEREARAARYAADTAIEESRRDYELRKSSFKQEGGQALAKADLAYDLQRAITQQEVRAAELQVEIVERQKAIELMEAEVARRINELEAELIEPAKAEARKIEALAEARREELASQGAGEADATRLRGMAEAEAMVAKAGAWAQYSDGAIADRLLEILPALAAAVAEPLSKTEKIVMIGGGDGDGIGAHKITRDVMKIVAEMPEVLEALTGKKLDDMVKALPKAGGGKERS
ncbi:MAG: flotillin [Solirubrobacterales bacterium]|jgi:flotillin|nr:flotillin [Solirubrobacterales bacterium]MDX6661908.1 flotillin [Solirubrobacterales bacterium]